MYEISTWLDNLAILFIIAAIVLAVIAIFKYQSIIIKLIVLEVITNLLMASCALWAYHENNVVYIDVCLTLALIMFLGSVAYFYFLSPKEAEKHV